MRVAFVDNQVCLRGTSVVVWGMAYHNQKILQNESIIIIRKDAGVEWSDEALDVFKDHFPVYFLGDDIINDFLLNVGVDVCMVECSGHPQDFVPTSVPTITHCVFSSATPMGTVHTSISEWVASSRNYVLPNMVYLHPTQDTWREFLKIPQDAVVFGRHGGSNTFNIPYVHEVVDRVAQESPNTYFLFLNTDHFGKKLPNKIFIRGTADLELKTKFINTCDAMLHARQEGETFGCACGEFALKNKNILTANTGDLSHIDLYGPDMISIYNGPEDLRQRLLSFTPTDVSQNGYHTYSPEHVMSIFKKYLDLAKEKF